MARAATWTGTTTEPTYEAADNVAKKFVVGSLVGLVIVALIGLIMGLERTGSFQTDFAPLSFVRLRPLHLQAVIFAWLSMGMMGAIYYVVPRMVKRDLLSKTMGNLHFVLQWVGILLVVVTLLAGYSEGREYLEPIWFIDVAVVIVWALFAFNVFATIIKSKAQQVHPGLKFIGASILYLGLNFVIGNFVPLNGIQDDNMVWLFAHNEVNGWFMVGLMGLMYYVVPQLMGIGDRPNVNKTLSNIHFWSLMLFIPPSTLHHLLYAEAPVAVFWKEIGQWTSVAMLIPTGIWIYLFYNWVRMRTRSLNPAGHFFFAAMVFYALNCMQGAVQSIIAVNQVVHQTQWVIGHAHLALVGWISFGLIATIYAVVPRLFGREVSAGLASAQLWTSVVGFGGMYLALSIGGVIEGATLQEQGYLAFYTLKGTLDPYLQVRTIFGGLFAVSSVVFLWNVYRSVLAPGREALPVEARVIR